MSVVALWLAAGGRGFNDDARPAAPHVEANAAAASRIPDADRLVLERIRAGDVAAFSALFHEHWAGLCTVAAIYTRDMADAEEIVASIFAELWERRASLRIAVKIRTYLHAAVKYRTTNWTRNRARRESLMHSAVDPAALVASVPGMGEASPSVHAAIEQDERLARVLAAVDALPDRYRIAFVYRWRDGWEYSDIADALGVSVGATKVLVTRALQMIRARVGDV